MTVALSPRQLSAMWETLTYQRERLAEMEADTEQDQRLHCDCLEGMTDDVFTKLDQIAAGITETKQLAVAIETMRRDLEYRQARFDNSRDYLRKVLLQMMQAGGITKLVRAGYTASISNGQPELIVDETKLPDAYWRHPPKEQNKTLIRAALNEGKEIAGARLGNAAPRLVVRTR